ncbi:DASH family cryptochrome [Portibacter marinus]|uniref:DASH family cryptochrome n=1 Tax=Portibacter marinus TaxID=2898660 RepID=UPI001F1BB264|nr:DASH family cryptochrome [Portibacter marinus]
MNKRGIVWFRADLRLHDNEAIYDAKSQVDELIYVYIFDERVFKGKTGFGFRKTDKYRARFIIESIQDLRNNLKEKGCRLIVRTGKPEEILFDICNESKASWIFCNRERTQEEIEVQDALEKNLWSIGREVRFSRGKMLYYTGDLPFPITQTPDTFTSFRKEVEKFVPIRKPLPTDDIELPDSTFKIEEGDIPNLTDFGFSEEEADFTPILLGGESAGLKEMNYYLWESDLVQTYKETRNGLLGRDYSSKFSAYLAQGCLSPKLIAHQIFKYEKERTKNESTYWLIFELMWRDFFRLMGKKYGNAIFQLGGIQQSSDVSDKEDMDLFSKWAAGETGVPFVDANMKEINATGFMSNRGRQNVASYLVNDLNLNWLLGAQYFESLLIDYDPCSNYGNWNYIAGVGNDPRSDRYFNIENQAKRYDPEGEFVDHWI